MKLLIIGAGPGGYETAAEAVRRGFDVTLVSDGPLGGTCLNEGCIPTKSLIHSKDLPLCEAVARKDETVKQLRDGIAFLLRKVNLIQGRASFVDAHKVEVATPDGGNIIVTADRIIIATGSVPSALPIPGAELALDSSHMLSSTQLPESLTVIGGGVIGLEFAGMMNARGVKVKVLEYCPNILPRFDADIAKRLRQQLVKSGIEVCTGAQVLSIERQGSGCRVSYRQGDEELCCESDCVLMAVGRKANYAGLNLEAAGVAYGPKGIVVDENMRTSCPDIYAIGDVTGGMMLAHIATFQGLRALNDLCGEKDSIDFAVVPAVVFTSPELASVGRTEEECKAAGLQFRSLKSFYRANGKAVADGLSDGYCKVLVGDDGRILGCHILGAHASDLIHEAAALISLGATVDQARGIIHAHPTLSEILQSALRS